LLQYVNGRVYSLGPSMHMTKTTRILFLAGVVSSSAAVACGIVIKRDLSTVSPGQVGYDDMCDLQDYFDSLEAGVAKEPVVASALDLEGGDGQRTVRGGKVRLLYEGDFLLQNARRILTTNWRRLPPELATAQKIEIEGRWAERAGVRRLVTDQDAELIVDGHDSSLPYHVCLSDFMFGAPLYRQRQISMGLPDPRSKRPLDLALDAGEPDAEPVSADTPDAGPPSVRQGAPAIRQAPPAAPPAPPPAAPSP
jgi:hypothetical protein